MAKGEKQLSMLDKQILAIMTDGREVGNPDDPAKEKWPNLWSWMTRTDAGKDHVMQPASLSIRAVGGGIHVSVSSRDLATSVGVTVLYLVDALDALEKALGDPSTPTTSWGRKEPQLRKRRPKSV